MLDFLINGFIIITFFVFVIFLFGGIRNLTKEIEKLNSYIDTNFKTFNRNDEETISTLNSFFKDNPKHVLEPSWSYFKSQAKNSIEAPDVFDYINRDYILYQLGKRKQIEIVSGLLVSFGILGTFLGLKLGLDKFNFDVIGDDSLQSGVGSLISGVNIAFTSSLIGIFLSVIWIFLDKFYFYPKLISSVDILMNGLNTILPREDSESYLKRLVNLQKEQLEAYKTMVTDTLIPGLVNGISESIKGSIVPHLERNQETMHQNNVAIEKMAENLGQQQADSLNSMANHFLNSLNEATSSHFDNLKEILGEMIEWNKTMFDKTNHLVEQLVDNTETQTKMGSQLTSLADQLSSYSDNLTRFQFEFNSSLELLNDVEGNLRSLQETAASSIEQSYYRHRELDSIQENLTRTMGEQLTTIDNRLENLKVYWKGSEDNLESLNQQLSQSMKEFANHMHSGLEHTFEQFDKNLRQALEYLQSSVMGIEDVMVSMPKLIEDFQSNLKQINESQNEFLQQENKWRKEFIKQQQLLSSVE
ncbi:hypothetical protein [Fredinandcohnia sp. 179-A 10B2 NHS]|uniref:hypothetical protein n=1 Tax=Fredinandcohnia sp. 179-A 10B2 NHS TaxID=3235176 RepID=UPI00399F75B9